MGGAAGHLYHLYENRDLTFAELKEVLGRAAEGKLERVSENLDGANLVFTWDSAAGELRVARTGSDISKGGMDAAALAKKFFGRGNVELIFNTAFTVLTDAIGALGNEVRARVFGPAGNRWYSMEIIYAPEPNTISYDSNNIVFHGWPIFEVDESGKVEQTDDDTGVELLSKHIDQMQKAVTLRDWRVRGPSLLQLKKLSDGSVLQRAIAEIDAAMSAASVSDSNTVQDYLVALAEDEAVALGLPPKAARAVALRATGAPGAPTVNDIKKMLPKAQHATMADFARSAPELQKKWIAPIERAIHRLAVEVLRGLHSTLIDRSDDEVMRLRAQVSKAIKAIEASGHEAAMEVLRREMQRLGSVDDIGAAMEGIVFIFKGQAYKFTGAFAPAHQILSLFKYGRKGIPKMDLGEARLRHALRRLLGEGGGGLFSDTGPIELERFEEDWLQIKADLELLGVTDVRPVGSTGKKRLMGDVDVAGRFDGGQAELFAAARDFFGASNVAKVGGSIVSVRYGDPPYQLDIMLGDPAYLSWGRAGTSDIEGHADYSPAKGVIRNLLLNVITRLAAELEFPGGQSDLDREKYAIDFDRGLYRVKQTKRNKAAGKPPLKDWRTLERELITDDPDELATTVFGPGTRAADLRSFEGVVAALRLSPKLRRVAPKVLASFSREIRQLAAKKPETLGSDPQATLDYLDKVISS